MKTTFIMLFIVIVAFSLVSANIAASNMNTVAYVKKRHTVNSDSTSSSGNSHDQKGCTSDGGSHY
jgi:hypothetical protein